jgi:transposase
MDVQIGIPRRLSYLPVVMDTLRRCGIFSVIEQAIKDDPRSKVTTSECVAVILCGVFLGHHDLWRLADRLAPFDMATVLQDPDVDLSLFTEERLAKALDDLYAADLDKLITPLAIHTIEQFRLSTDFVHFDTTSLTLFGAYESEEFGSMSESIVPTPPMISYGYSKDHRPDLKQILFGTLVSCDGGVPLYGKALDGNRSDNESAAEFFKRVRSLVKNPKEVCCVADSKGWCARVLHVIQNDHLRLLSRLPRNHTLHSVIMAKPWTHPERVQRLKANGKPSEDYYELIGYDVEEVLSYKDARTTPAVDTVIEVPSRAVRVFSSALLRQKLGTLERTTKREATRATKMMKEWGALAYACEEDAQRAAERDQRSVDFVTLDISTTVRSVAGPFKRGRGRPSKRGEAALASSHYRIDYQANAVSTAVTKERLILQASFVLIRTRTAGWTISDQEMIERYKGQYYNEHGFSWLKSGPSYKGINPMYLATPSRIASLCFLYVVGLMGWTLIQRTVRGNLKKWKQGLPYHRNKPSDHITTRFFFELFPLVQVVPFAMKGEPEQRQLVGITPTLELACKAIGTPLSAFLPKIRSGK